MRIVKNRDEYLKAKFEPRERTIDFGFYLLNNNNEVIREVLEVTGGRVSYDIESHIKRTAKLDMIDDGSIDFLDARIMITVRISYPKRAEVGISHNTGSPGVVGYKDNPFYTAFHPTEPLVKVSDGGRTKEEEYPIGVFVVVSPSRYEEGEGAILRSVDAYDLSYLVDEYRLTNRLLVKRGTPYMNVIKRLLGDLEINTDMLEDDYRKANRDIEYDEGESALVVINDLLKQIGYTPLNFTSYGDAVALQYLEPEERPTTHFYGENNGSNVIEGVEITNDHSEAYNVFTVVASNEDNIPMRKVILNDNPEDPLSIYRRGKEVVYFEKISDISDERALELYARRVANEKATGYGTVTFYSPIIPNHCCYNMVDFKHSPLDIEGRFLEIEWEIELEAGAPMKHILQYRDLPRRELY